DAAQRGQPPSEHGALLAHSLQQLVVDRVADGASRRADNRVAAEGARVVAGLEPWRRTVGGEEAADWKAVGEALGEHHRVGADVELLVGEERPGPAPSR